MKGKTGVVALVQARMSSSRLPGKVLMRCGRGTFLGQQIQRIESAQVFDEVVVLTSSDSSDDPIVQFCDSFGIAYFRGNLSNVFNRFQSYLLNHRGRFTHFARFTADCPFVCSDIAKQLVKLALENGEDYLSNTLYPTFPDGMDIEIVRISAFLKLLDINLSSYEYEHVTPGLYLRPVEFSLGNLVTKPNLSNYRWTLDEPRDSDFLSRVASDYPEIVLDSRYTKIRDFILVGGSESSKTTLRERISPGPWTEYPLSI